MSKSPINSSKESRGRRVTLFFESILGHIVSTNPFDEPFQIPEPHQLAIEFTNSASELTKKDMAPRSLTRRVMISSVCARLTNESGLVRLSKCVCVHLCILRPYFFPSSHLTKSTKIRLFLSACLKTTDLRRNLGNEWPGIHVLRCPVSPERLRGPSPEPGNQHQQCLRRKQCRGSPMCSRS